MVKLFKKEVIAHFFLKNFDLIVDSSEIKKFT